jgi:hypothetical protein
VPKKLFKPVKCSDEGGVCDCARGNVFFGVSQGDNAKRSEAFPSLTDSPYAIKRNVVNATLCVSDSFGAKFPLMDTKKECFCDAYKTYSGEEIGADMERFTSEWRIKKMEQQAKRLRAQKRAKQTASRNARRRAQKSRKEQKELAEKYKREAKARQQAAWEAKDARLQAARDAKAKRQSAAQERRQAAEKAYMDRKHKAQMKRADALKRMDQAQHDRSMNRIQNRIDAARARDEAERESDRADAERAKAMQ